MHMYVNLCNIIACSYMLSIGYLIFVTKEESKRGAEPLAVLPSMKLRAPFERWVQLGG